MWTPSDPTALKTWLTRTLTPLSDAEPDVLADFVLALLRQDGDRSKVVSSLTGNLAEFLGDASPGFAADVVDALETESYLGPSVRSTEGIGKENGKQAQHGRTQPPKPPPQPIPTRDSEERLPHPKRKRSISPGPNGGFNKAGKVGPYNAPRRSDGFNNHPRQDEPEANPLFAGGRMVLPPYAAAALQATPAEAWSGGRDGLIPTGLCRNYHLRGFCSRGGSCKYSHAPLDVPTLLGVYRRNMARQPFQQPASRAPGGMYAPSQPGFAWAGPGQGGAPFYQPATQQLGGEYDPSAPSLVPPGSGFMGAGGSLEAGRSNHPHGRAPRDNRSLNHAFGAPNPSHVRVNNTRLAVQNIPQASATEETVREHFSQFGQLTFVSVDPSRRKATVQFATPEEARTAKNDPSVLFGDRFVKVFFARERPEGADEPQQGHAHQVQQQPQTQQFKQMQYAQDSNGANNNYALLGSSHSPVASTQPSSHPMSSRPAPAPPTYPTHPKPRTLTAADVKMLLADARLKQSAVQAQLDEQKKLMLQLTSSAPAGEKVDRAEAMTRLRALAQEIPQNTTRAKEAAEKATKAQAEQAANPPQSADHARGGKRGTPSYRMGGGKLDFRPTTLLVEPLSPEESGEDERMDPAASQEHISEHFQAFGTLLSVAPMSEGSGWTVKWANRHEGDKAVWNGNHVPGVGQVRMRWAPAGNTSAVFSVNSGSRDGPSESALGSDGQHGVLQHEEPDEGPEVDTSNADDLYAV